MRVDPPLTGKLILKLQQSGKREEFKIVSGYIRDKLGLVMQSKLNESPLQPIPQADPSTE